MDSVAQRYFFWLVLLLLIIVFFVLVSSILLPFVVGMLAAYFLDPAADSLERRGLSRGAATGIITAVFFSFIAISAIVLLPLMLEQSILLLNNLPEYVKNTTNLIESNIQKIAPEYMDVSSMSDVAAQYSSQILTVIVRLSKGLLESGGAFLSLMSLIFISPVISFFLLRDWDKMVAKIDVFLPRKHAVVIRKQVSLIDDVLSGYIRGQSNVCIMLAIFYGFGLTLAGLDFGLFIGLVTGLLAFIPYVGMALGMVSALIVAFFQFGDLQNILIILSIFIIGQIIEGNFITPKLVGEKVGLHPVWIIFGLLAGGALFGFVGVLIAIPVTAVIGVLIRFALSVYMNGSLYEK